MSTVDDDDVILWLAWKRVSEITRGRILADVLAHSPLTEQELTVLAHLDEAHGTMRQNALAAATGWDRSRLSHLLSRMEQRGYMERRRLRNGVEVAITAAGGETLRATQPPLGVAVQEHITSRLNAEQRAALQTVIAALGERAEPVAPAPRPAEAP